MALTKISTAMISQDAASVDLNIDAGTLYIDSTNNRVGVANTSPATALDVTGTITADNIKLGDNQRVQIGDGQDFQFYHDGSNSYILATGGSGSLITRADVFGVQDSSNINMIEAASTTGVVTLYYNTGSTSAARLATSSTGVSVTGNLTTTGYIAGPATFTIDPAAVGDNTGTVVIAGNLQVDGTTTTINSTTVNVDDLNIQLATGAANAAAANGAGITVDGASATITYDGTNDEWDFNKDVNVTGTLTASGGSSNNDSTANILTLNASEHARLVVDTSSTGGHRATLALKSNNNETQLTTTGSASFLNVASGNLTVDVAGDIVLDADGGDIFLRDAGSEFGRFQGSNQDWLIRNDAQDKDILIVGNDGGTVITALTLDMSEAGRATFNDNVNLGDTKKLVFGDGDDLQIYHDASNNYVDAAGVGHLYLQSQGDDRDVKIRSDDGSGGLTEYFRADGSLGQAQLFYYGSKKLHTVTGGIDVTGTVTADGLTVDGDVTVTGASAISLSSVQHITYQTTSTNATAGDHIFKSYNTEIMRIDGNNNRVGIGTNSPNSPLHIQADGIGLRFDGSANTQKSILFRSTGVNAPGEVYADGSLRFRTEDANTFIQFHTNSTGSNNERMIIKSNGLIGINQSNPDTYLHIKGTSDNQLLIEGDQNNSNVGLFFRNNGTNKWELYHRGADNQFTLYSYAAGDRVVVVDPAGKVGIGSSSLDPATSLDVTSAGEGGIRIKPATQIAYTPSSLSNFRQGLTLENAGSGHAFSIGYGQGGWLKFSHFDNSSTYSELARMETSGDFRPAGSVLLNDGEGISFAATGNGNGSNSSELFDDYEEGTWTIVLKDGTGNTYSGTYQSRNGRYTKVGRLVHATFELYVGQVDLTANGLSGNQGVRIAGFPYNSNSSQFSGGVINNSNGINYTANSSICLAMARNVNEVMLRSFLPSTASGEGQITVTQFNNGNRLVYGTIMYEAS